VNHLEGPHGLEGPDGLPTAHRSGQTRRPGFYDPHNHWTGIISWNGIGLATEDGKIAMDTEMNEEGAREILDAFKDQKCGTKVQGKTIEGSRAPFKDEDQLYVYQFLHSGKICGIEICDAAEFASLCTLMKKISHAVNTVLAKHLTDENKIFKQSPMAVKGFLKQSNVYGTMTLLPLLKCAQIAHKENNKEKLANTLMSAMSASPMIDFDTSCKFLFVAFF
jgi:ArsR family metal-binding transcriptional regulator